MSDSYSEIKQRDQQVLLHPASSIIDLQDNGPSLMLRGEGNEVIDVDDRRYLDAIAGLWCVNVGYGRKRLASAMALSAEQLGYYHSFGNAGNIDQVRLADKLLSLAPGNMGKVFFGSSGSDANDTLVKIAWHYHSLQGNPRKIKIIARDQAYHGTSISTASLTGLGGFHKDYPIPLDFVLRTECPHYYTRAFDEESEADFCDRLIRGVEGLIAREGADTIAAFIAEPIQAAGGIIVPPAGYFDKLVPLLKAHNILLIADEVVCGMGRLGDWFGAQALGFEPDMMAVAKGLTSGYFPLSASLLTNEVYQVLAEGSRRHGAFYHGYTYSGHPVGAAVALENIAILEEENLLQKVRELGTYLHEQLNEKVLPLPMVGEIRGQGLLAGVQLVADKKRAQLPDPAHKWPQHIAAAARAQGVIVRPLPSVATLALSPPFTITYEQVDKLVATLTTAINDFHPS